jgi:hypothetical protein
MTIFSKVATQGDVKSPNESEHHVMWFVDNGINMKDDNDQNSNNKYLKPVEIFLLWFYSPLLGLGRFFSFLILYTGIAQSGLYIHALIRLHGLMFN